jgi:predicted lipoprotein with Yx(FWY)xxD motif
MRKPIIIGVIILIVIVAGGFLLFGGGSDKPKSSMASRPESASKPNATNAPAVNNAVLMTKTDGNLGQYLTDPNGKPLYTYDADSANASNCHGSCLANWPVYRVTGSTAKLPSGVGTIKRADNGQTQYTYHGMPLYYFTGDSQGHINGDGVEDFSIARPQAASSPQSQPESPSTSAPSQRSSSYPY